ncbi:GNAT family N-acetyltransferase [candidate division WOR-3 bacterium]|uniref:GNAT family N-acetyltransferase n=1 Tax=candidate division WOR-3 bacterium TaxID=2052148 RepID=A0A937XC25_UNCW3|nr:GNAT family N-acetyltransferase [candidate division WOR-3 bacterium]
MEIRSIRPEELEACCAFGGTGWLANVVGRIWEEGTSSPELSFVAEDGGRPVGRVFFHRRSSPTEMAMFGTHIGSSVDFFATGTFLLNGALARLSERGVAGVEYAIHDVYDPDPTLYKALVEAVGFRQRQEKKRYVWQNTGSALRVRLRLEFRPMSDEGEDAFAAAVGRVTVGTLDRQDRVRIRKHGAAETARWYMRILREGEFKPSEWLLGYLADGRLCGLVVPKRMDKREGTIEYIGVVPELRGHGYGFDLLVKGTAMLQQNGFGTVVAETDSENLPFCAELERATYVHRGTLRSFRCDLGRGAGGCSPTPGEA